MARCRKVYFGHTLTVSVLIIIIKYYVIMRFHLTTGFLDSVNVYIYIYIYIYIYNYIIDR